MRKQNHYGAALSNDKEDTVANDNAKRLQKAVKAWARGTRKVTVNKQEVTSMETVDGKETEVTKMVATKVREKSPKAAGKDRPGHGRKTNVGDPGKSS